ncbi:uncharacterized protein LOC134251560 [Saccostrea cucullata]|uniref:uncharacterized protein LOC134251560 n=1 Tax=Saccostrea cuccullata TaxID=36930 RepID=UPI002ED543DF
MDDLHPKSDHPIECRHVILNQSTWFLNNGQRLCLSYKTESGGYMKYKDFSNKEYPAVTYNRVTESNDVCFLFDSSPPKHCSEILTCPGQEPIKLISGRLTKDSTLKIKIEGWNDPFPRRPDQASGIKSFSISIHETKEVDNLTLSMDEKALQTFNISHGEFNVTLPHQPALFGISLEVLDHAGNVKSARRFVMFDNSSEIKINDEKRLKVYTASSKTNYTWQTNKGQSCLSWENRYYNSYNLRYNLLRKMQKDYHGIYQGVYEQESGILPISGTTNVFGIVSYHYSWFKENKRMSSDVLVPRFPIQSLCVDLDLKDGETRTITVTSKDLMNNSLSENITFHVDSSVPDIENIWLKKDGVRQLFVHNSTDLSKMKLEFKAFDSHSGLYSIEYFLGTSLGGKELAYKAIAVQTLGNKTCEALVDCYCPSVGPCEHSIYRVEFNHLIKNNTHIGQHNREYHFTVKVTNEARLVSIQHVDILSDDSPPHKGVVYEGPQGYPDIDYTSENSVNVRWDGFIDHESGIMKYRIGISDHCLTNGEMDVYSHNLPNNFSIYESTEQFLSISLPNDGLYVVSVIAYNNALEPSDVACSDGVTRDSSKVIVTDVVLESAKGKAVIGCYENKAWHILQNLTAYELKTTEKCLEICSSNLSMSLIAYLPKSNLYANHSEYSTTMCSKLSQYTENWFIYLPSDKIKVTWKLEEKESQIQNVEVGLGSTASTFSFPDLISYSDSHKTDEYHIMHAGLDTGLPLYLFLRVINKADLKTLVTFGPLIIDETPPIYKGNVVVFQDSADIVVGWNSDTFLEAEQKEPMDSILFRLGSAGTLLTPYLEAKIKEQCPRNLSFCFKYSINRIFKLNFNSNTRFNFHLYIYNIAGHFLEVRSESFLLPSRFPPSNGTIIEILPNHSLAGEDVDFIFQANKVCFDWKGMWHTQNISLEVGIGSTKESADIVSFRNISENTKCLYNLKLAHFKKYYTIARATVGLHSTLIVSDGFAVIDNSSILNSLVVHSGTSCRMRRNNHIPIILNKNQGTLSVINALRQIQVYTILTDGSPVTSQDVVWIDKYQFVPIISYPTFHILNTTALSNVSISSCEEGKQYQESKHSFEVFWTANNETANFITHYKCGLFKINKDGSNTIVEPLKDISRNSQFQFTGLHLQNFHTYRALVQPCFQKVCLQGKFSESVTVEEAKYPINETEAFVKMIPGETRVVDVQLRFSAYECGLSGEPLGYAAAFLDTNVPQNQLTSWILFSPYSGKGRLNGNLTFHLPVYGHRRMEICIKGICKTGQSINTCTRLTMLSDPNEFSTLTLYEIYPSSVNLQDILRLANSQFLGDKLQLLHENEVDVTPPGRKIYGFLSGTSGKSITWYLTKKQLSQKVSCQSDMDCLQSVTSTDGIGRFNTQRLPPNHKYFICAFSEGMNSTENKVKSEDISLCGNGFIVDNSPPKGGEVKILSSNEEFVTSEKELEIQWSGFSDIEVEVTHTELGIARYEFSIGSFQSGQDILLSRNVGLQTSVFIPNLNLTNGMTYFATVKAFDRAGHVTVVSSPGKTLDVTPPDIGTIFIGNPKSQTATLSTDNVFVHWEGFGDNESGLKQILIGVGSSNVSTDILEFYPVDGEFVEIQLPEFMTDGYQYYILLKIVNHADLSVIAASEAFLFDRTPPLRGLVQDGLTDDVDFQNDTGKYACHWSGFLDSHTGIQYFEVGIGTQPFNFDVFPASNVGLLTDFTWNSIFEPGVKYFATVTACNHAELCTSVSSDGVIMDNSPPIPGLIHVGFSDQHEPFMPYNNSISASWVGFVDPHSDIDHFEWCLGTSPGYCQIVAFENIMLSNRVTRTGLHLPHSTDLYLTLRAFNQAGLVTERTSPKFQVDPSPPVLVQKPEFITGAHGLSLINGTQFDGSLITIRWLFQDRESSIIKHHIILISSRNGHVMFEKNEIGSQTHITIKSSNETLLRDGDSYVAKVTSCNGAGLCTFATSSTLLIDSSPPSLGGFMNPLLWHNNGTTTTIHLAWYGFVDNESGLQKYTISVSKSYSGNELSNGLISVQHSNRTQQVLSLNLSNKLYSNDVIILSVTGTNNVGLKSKTGKVSVVLVSNNKNNTQGHLSIQRYSCVSHYCNNDCTCAVIGKKCLNKINAPCTELQNVSSASLNVLVHFGLSPIPSTMSASSSCISGFWEKEAGSISTVMRYEWSLGEKGESPGSGIFDAATESIWHDNGISQELVYCLPSHKRLQHGQHYILYIRAWVSESEFAIFTSNSLLIDFTPPQVRLGRAVIESVDDCRNDVDFIGTLRLFKVCWQKLFSEGQGHIVNYDISGGTRPYGDDFISRRSVHLSTSLDVNQTMIAGTTYYFTIFAKNNMGLETAAVSDGILLDVDNPVSGIVYNTKHFRNILHQSSNSSLATSWHGFEDHQSSIKLYEVGVYEEDDGTVIKRDKSASISTFYTFNNISLQHNRSYHTRVRAFDAMDHHSQYVNSNPIKIDNTPPVGIKCKSFEKIEFQVSSITNNTDIYNMKKKMVNGVFTATKNEIYKILIKLPGRLQFSTLKLHIGNKTMLLYTSQTADSSTSAEHEFLSSNDGPVNLRFKVASRKDIPDESISVRLQHCSLSEVSTNPLTVRQINPGTLSVCSFIFDPESGVENVLVGAGTTRGGYQVRLLSPFSKSNHGLIHTDAPHGSRIYLTAIARNYADLSSMFQSEITLDHSAPILKILNVDVRNFAIGQDLDFLNDTDQGAAENDTTIIPGEPTRTIRKHTEVTVTWNVTEEETELLSCYCSVGHSQASALSGRWQTSPDNRKCKLSNLSFPHGTTIYVTVQCINNVQLKAEEIAGPFKIYHKSPQIESATLSFYPNNRNTFLRKESAIPLQENLTNIDFFWKGFQDEGGISTFETRVRKNGKVIAPWNSVGLRNCATRVIQNSKAGDIIDADVRAANDGGYRSQILNSSIVLDNRSPGLEDESASFMSTGGYVSIRWNNVFVPSQYGATVYQVSVGSSAGSSDLQSPISTLAEEVQFEWTPGASQHQIFVNILAFAPNGEFSRYNTRFYV